MQTRRTRRFRSVATRTRSAAPVRPAVNNAPAFSAPDAGSVGKCRHRFGRPSALGADTSRAWRVMVLVVLAAVAFRPLNALCRLIVEESRKVAVAVGFAPAREEVTDARPLALAEVERAPAAPSVDARPAVAAVAPAAGTTVPAFSSDRAFGEEAANPFARTGGGTTALVSAAPGGFSLTAGPAPARAAVGRPQPVAGSAPAAVAVPQAAGQSLIVDQADNTSPYSVTTDQTFDNVTVGDTSVGTLDHGAGTLTVTGTLTVGNAANSSGSYTLHGTGSLVTSGITVGEKGNGLFTQSGGMATTNNGAVYVGDGNGGNGSYVLSGTGSLSTSLLFVGAFSGSQGSFVQSGGTVTATANQGFIYVGDSDGSQGNYLLGGTGSVSTGILYLGAFSGSQGSFNLNGGTLTAGSVGQSLGGTGTFNFNGGTLRASASDNPGDPNNPTTFFSGVAATNVRNGGAVIDTNSFNVTVASPLTHSTLGTPGTAGTITSAGSGYTSAPTVTVTGGGGYGATAVATINVQGQVTGVTLTNPGTNYTGAPTFAFSGGGGSGAAATDPFTLDNAIDGGLTKNGAGTLTLTGNNTYTGQTTVNAGTLAFGNGGSLTNNGNFVVQGGAALTLAPGSSVTVDSLFIGNPNSAGNVMQNGGSVTTTPNTNSYVDVGGFGTGTYTLSGGKITTDQLETGVFASGTFTMTSGTTVVAGAVKVGVAAGGGVGVFNQNGGTVTAGPAGTTGDSGVLLARDAGSTTFGAAAVGTYNLNGGTLTTPLVAGLGGTSTFRFNGGTLQASASDNPGAASNPTTFFSGLTNTYVEAGGAVIDTNGFNVTVASQLSDDPAVGFGFDGGLTKNGAGTLTMAAQNLFYGPVTVNAGTLQAGAIYQAFGQGESAVTLANAAGVTLAVNGYYEEIGSLTGGGTKGGTVDLTGGTLDTGNDGTDTTFSGLITGAGGLTKSGAGMFTLTTNNTYTGTTFVNYGALMVCNVPAKAGDSGTGSGNVYVGQGAWLGGTGSIGGSVTVGANPPNTSQFRGGAQPRVVSGSGTLTPGVAVGDASTPGRLTINGNLTFTSGGTSVFEVDLAGAKAGTGYDQVLVGGSLTLAGTLTLTTGAGFTPTLLEKFFLIDLTGNGTTSGTFDGLAQGALVTDSAGNEYRINYFDHDLADTSNLLFDDVSLTAVEVVPEPGTWALLGIGAFGMGLVALRRHMCGPFPGGFCHLLQRGVHHALGW